MKKLKKPSHQKTNSQIIKKSIIDNTEATLNDDSVNRDAQLEKEIPSYLSNILN